MRTFPSLTLPLWLTLTGCSLIVAPDAGLIGDDDGGGGTGAGGQPSGGAGGQPSGGNGGEPSLGGGGENPGGGGSNPGGFGGDGGQGGDGGIGGVGGTGGEGGGPECTSPAMCPDPAGPCEQATCIGNVCGFAPLPSGTVTPVQADFDCQENQCDGAGAVISVDDDADEPVDNNACTDDVCTAGVPSNPDLPAGTACGVGLVCDGTGTCDGCTMASQCPGIDNECQTRTCSGLGACGFNFTAAGTDVAAQIDGDCEVDECDGTGNIIGTVDNSDVPVDNLDCTTDECDAGVPENNPVAEGDACDDNGGDVCDDSGLCVECNVAADCGVSTACATFTCTANACGVTFVPNNTPTGTQTAGNCQLNVCNGTGTAINVDDNGDVPIDNLDCTLDVCTSGVPSNPDGPSGGGCNDNGGVVCNATGDCVQCLMAAMCPGMDTDCQTRTCSGAGTCGFDFDPNGTATSMQTAGNCQQSVCNGSGGTTGVPDNADVPVDANECTNDLCTLGVPSNPPSAAGTVCSTGFCNGAGACVAPACNDGAQNGDETDIDCGGGTCPACATGDSCLINNDCDSNSCTLGFCDPICGDGVAEGGEGCDDGNANNNDSCPDGVAGSCEPATCGDGFIFNTGLGNEQCDDDNTAPGDGCSATCQTELALPGVTSVDFPVIARGARLVVTGTDFTGATGVTVGGVAQTFVVNSNTQITIAALADGTPLATQPVVVTTGAGSSAAFNVSAIRLLINEIDVDTPGTDAAEFVEISTGVPGVNLAGYNLTFWNGATDASYFSINLNTTTDANGLLILGNVGLVPAPPAGFTFANDFLQQGADAVAIYQGAPFANGTALTATGRIDALVYDTADGDDPGLLDTLLGAVPFLGRVQVDEAIVASQTQSISRCETTQRHDGRSFVVDAAITPGAVNTVAACPIP